MKQPLIGTANIHLYFPPQSEYSVSSVLELAMQAKAASTSAVVDSSVSPKPPAIGSLWEDQGGIYMGIREYPDSPHHLIAAETDIDIYAWGEQGVEVDANSKTDGLTNTLKLCSLANEYPAAIACVKFQSGKFHDFYLPAIAELHHCWLTVPESFAKDTYYWSSSQRSANFAFTMLFGDGFQGYGDKLNELRVRPVRRLPIY